MSTLLIAHSIVEEWEAYERGRTFLDGPLHVFAKRSLEDKIASALAGVAVGESPAAPAAVQSDDAGNSVASEQIGVSGLTGDRPRKRRKPGRPRKVKSNRKPINRESPQ